MISQIIIACLLSSCRSKAPGQPVLDGQDGEEGHGLVFNPVEVCAKGGGGHKARRAS